MPALHVKVKVKRRLAEGHRNLAVRELVPVMQEHVYFPAWLLELVREHGLGDLRLKDVWSRDFVVNNKRKRPYKFGTEDLPDESLMEIVRRLDREGKPVPKSVLAKALGKPPSTVRNRLQKLISTGFVESVGIAKDAKYRLTDGGLDLAQTQASRRPRKK